MRVFASLRTARLTALYELLDMGYAMGFDFTHRAHNNVAPSVKAAAVAGMAAHARLAPALDEALDDEDLKAAKCVVATHCCSVSPSRTATGAAVLRS